VQLLFRSRSAVPNVLFAACGVLCLVGWCVLVRYDHHDMQDAYSSMDPMHAAGVVIFMVTFLLLHAASSWTYAEDIALVNLTRFAMFRREAYIFSDILYVVMCVVFAVFVILQHNEGAITAEYIILAAFEVLNLVNLYIQSRLVARTQGRKLVGSSGESDEYVVTLSVTR